MKTWAFISGGSVSQIFLPVLYDTESPFWQEGDPSRIGQEIPITERFHPDLLPNVIDITDLEVKPDEGWLYDGFNFSPPGSNIKLSDVVKSKIEQLRGSCDAAITRGAFTSTALGLVHNYDCRAIDQTNLLIRIAAVQSNEGTQPLWASDGTRYDWIEHTKDQLESVIIDMNNHIVNNQRKLVAKIAQTESATTIKQVEKISW